MTTVPRLRSVPTAMDRYTELVAAFPDTESLTVLSVAGATRGQVAAQLRVDLSTPVDDDIWAEEEEVTAWALLDVPGGVLAVELSGFGDPSNADLAALSALSAAGGAAVTRSNILAHYRFGCARNGGVLFDDNEFTFTEDPDAVPAELRTLLDLVYDDLDDRTDESAPQPFAVGLAMAEVITGVEISTAHISSVYASGFFAAPSQRYLDDSGNTGNTEDEVDIFDPRRPRRDSRDIPTRSGMYAIAADADSVGEPPAHWPADTLCVAEGETVWIRKLSTDRDVAVRPMIWAGSFEPPGGFGQVRAVCPLEGSAILTGRTALRIFDEGLAFGENDWSGALTNGGYTAELRVFAKPAEKGDDYEEHYLYVWPEGGVAPDWLD